MNRMIVSPFGPEPGCRTVSPGLQPCSNYTTNETARNRHGGRLVFRNGVEAPDYSNDGRSGIDQDLEPAPEHALAVERHRLRVHHLRHALVLHDLGGDAVAVRARL